MTEVMYIENNSIQSADIKFSGDETLIKGISKLEDRLVIILNSDNLVNIKKA